MNERRTGSRARRKSSNDESAGEGVEEGVGPLAGVNFAAIGSAAAVKCGSISTLMLRLVMYRKCSKWKNSNQTLCADTR
jgi:hypothetical protein